MDIVVINHTIREIYTNSTEALKGGRRKDIEKVYPIPDYQFVPCRFMHTAMSGSGTFNLTVIDDVRGAAVLIVEISYRENNSNENKRQPNISKA